MLNLKMYSLYGFSFENSLHNNLKTYTLGFGIVFQSRDDVMKAIPTTIDIKY